LSTLIVATALAQNYPANPVKIVVPFAAGGSIDAMARIMQQKLAARLGQTVIVENRPGASTQLGTINVAKSAPDGYTVLFASEAHAINHVFNKKRQYDAVRDFAPLTLLVRFPLVFYGSSALGAATLRDAVALVKTQPGKLNYGSMGPGTSAYLLFEFLKRRDKLDMTGVPYQGAAPVMQALVSGQVQLSVLNYAIGRGAISAGRIKPLAVTGPKRIAELPDVPTVSEQGLPDLDSYSWFAAFAPAGTPEPVVARLSADLSATIADRDVAAKFAAHGWEGVGSSPQELERWVGEEIKRWEKFVRESGVELP
jgi:tripartite-type tricarboxylate transporter receptor subunit TctC